MGQHPPFLICGRSSGHLHDQLWWLGSDGRDQRKGTKLSLNPCLSILLSLVAVCILNEIGYSSVGKVGTYLSGFQSDKSVQVVNMEGLGEHAMLVEAGIATLESVRCAKCYGLANLKRGARGTRQWCQMAREHTPTSKAQSGTRWL